MDGAQEVLDYLTGEGFLESDGDLLFIGAEAERRFGRRHFMDLTAVFTADPELTVLHGRAEVGSVSPASLTAATVRRGSPACWRWPGGPGSSRTSTGGAGSSTSHRSRGVDSSRWSGGAGAGMGLGAGAVRAGRAARGGAGGAAVAARGRAPWSGCGSNAPTPSARMGPCSPVDECHEPVVDLRGRRGQHQPGRGSRRGRVRGHRRLAGDHPQRAGRRRPGPRCGGDRAGERCHARVTEEALDGLKFSAALPREVAAAVLADRMTQPDVAREVAMARITHVR